MKVYRCLQCGFEYDEAQGWEEEGFPPGTKWEDIPDDGLPRFDEAFPRP